jgi:acyl-CoA hydrolase
MTTHIATGTLDFTTFVRANDTVCWGQAAAEPVTLTRTLMSQRARIGSFNVFVGFSWTKTIDAQFCDHVNFTSYCAAGSNRILGAEGLLKILPCHYSALDQILPERVDVLLLHVAPPGPDGRYSFSFASEYLARLVDSARVIIAEVNDQAPFTYCDPMISPNAIDVVVPTSRPLLETKGPVLGPVEADIGKLVAGLVEDGAVVQVGLGSIPEAILHSLADHRDLGLHSGLIYDSVVDLIECGAITNVRKTLDPGVSVTGLIAGGCRLATFAHHNASLVLKPTGYVHAQHVLERLDRFTAINSAIEVDVTGQVNAETTDTAYVGAVGGASDFLRGAGRARGGLPIVALPSTARGPNHPVSRIVNRLSGPVSTSRADAGIIVTEHGVADLRGKSIDQRIKSMIRIAAPQFREELSRAAASTPGSGRSRLLSETR